MKQIYPLLLCLLATAYCPAAEPAITPTSSGSARAVAIEVARLVKADAWAVVPKPGGYWLVVSDGEVTAIYTIHTDDEPPPPPPDSLVTWVVDAAKDLDADRRVEVAKWFADAVPKIKSGELRGSKAIVEAVSKPISAMDSVKWQAFSTVLYEHLLNELRLLTLVEWAEAYESVAEGLKGGAKP